MNLRPRLQTLVYRTEQNRTEHREFLGEMETDDSGRLSLPISECFDLSIEDSDRAPGRPFVVSVCTYYIP